MKCFTSLAKKGVMLSLLAFSSFLQANHGENALDANSVEHNHHQHADRHHCSSQHTISHNIVALVKAWRDNAAFLKDGFQLTAAGFPGNEFLVVNQYVIDNAARINTLIRSSDDSVSTDVQSALLSMSFNFYAYIGAYQTDSSALPTIIQNLQEANTDLLIAITKALHLKPYQSQQIGFLLELRLLALKDLALSFIVAETGEYDDAYQAFSDTLRISTILANAIGRAADHDLNSLDIDSSEFEYLN